MRRKIQRPEPRRSQPRSRIRLLPLQERRAARDYPRREDYPPRREPVDDEERSVHRSRNYPGPFDSVTDAETWYGNSGVFDYPEMLNVDSFEFATYLYRNAEGDEDIHDLIDAFFATARSTRASARRAAKEAKREPGQVSPTLRRRMGPVLADIFDGFGPETYGGIVLALKESLKTRLEEGIAGVEAEVQAELGRRGVEEAQEHFRAWMDEFVEDLIHHGMDEASVTVEEIGDSLVAEFATEDGDEMLDVDLEEVDVVEEEDVEELDLGEEEEPEEEEGLELDLEAIEIEPILEGAGAS